MTGDELAQCIDVIGWSVRETARRMECPMQTVARMISGERPIPEATANWARSYSALADTMRPPPISARTKVAA